MGFDIAKTILVWRFDIAPPEYRELSPHFGDEDWLAFVPVHYEGDYIPWLDPWMRSGFGYSDVSEHLVDGGRVFIGAHA